MSVLLLSAAAVLLFPVIASAALPSLKVLSMPTCPACARMEAVVKDLGADYNGKLTAEMVNLMEHRDIARQYNIKYVPHLLFLDASGSVVKENVGALSRGEVLSTFKEAGVDLAAEPV